MHFVCSLSISTVFKGFRDIHGLLRLPAERLLANGIVAGGFLAYFLFWHPSYSQLYFVLIAIMFYESARG